MSSKAKKRKVSMEPVLQDFTVTSFSDLHSDVAGPSDSSLFEEIKNFNVELPEISIDQTADINLSSGPFPSDSSLDSLIKPQSVSKKMSEARRPFQKRSVKKSVEQSLFDSCLKDSFSDHSLEKVHKPFKRKQKKEVRLSMFDSDLESNTSNKDSPFKKPFQRKSKKKLQPNLFDSLINDPQLDSPNKKLSKLFQRKSKKKISSNFFDDDFLNDSSNQPSPAQNFITRRKNTKKQSNDSNLFDEDLGSSQSDVSMPLQPLGIRLKTASNDIKNYSGMFDDLLDAKDNESQNEKSSVLDSYNKNNYLIEDNTKSFNLEYNEESGGSTKDVVSLKIEETKEPGTELEGTDHHEETKDKNKFMAGLSDEQSTSKVDECLKIQEIGDKGKVVQTLVQRDFLEDDEAKEQNGGKLSNQQDPLEPSSVNLEYEGARESEQNEGYIDSTAELTETRKFETEDEETIEFETDEETLQNETENEETIQFENEDGGVRPSEESEGESESRAELSNQSDLPVDENAKEIDKRKNTDLIHQPSSYVNNSKNINRSLEGDDYAKDADENMGTSQDRVSVAREPKLTESIHTKMSLPRTVEVSTNYNHRELGLQISPTPIEEPLQNIGELIYSPDGSFKGMPSSTPNVKGKRVSFVLKEEICFRGSKENYANNTGTSTRKKSSLRSNKGNNDSSIVNNLTKDNSMQLRKRRVSFKIDNRGSDSSKQSDVKNRDKLEQSKGNQSNNYYSSVSLESLVYVEPSGSRTLDSESVYIDIHPSRSKSTSSSNTESLGSGEKKTTLAVSVSRVKSNSFNTADSCAENTEICEGEETNFSKESCRNIEEGHGNNNLDSSCVEEKSIENANNEAFSSSENEKSTYSSAVYATSENKSEEEEESGVEEEESGVEEEESEEEQEESEEQDESEEEQDESEEESEETKGHDASAKEQLVSEQESEEEQDSVAEDQETERHSSKRSGHEEFVENNITSCEQDENLNPDIKVAGEFKCPFKKQIRGSSLFKEKHLEVPNKAQLQDLLNKIPISEFKRRNKRKLSEHCISREQMQHYKIEKEMMKNQEKKTQNKKTFSASSKLKRPKKWVSPALYDFLINKLKPHYRIKSRVRAEELVLFLVERVECIKKKKELVREDVEEMKIELARLGIVKTHWDFFKLVQHYFENPFIEKLYPSLPGVGRSAFEFGPTNVMENILESAE